MEANGIDAQAEWSSISTQINSLMEQNSRINQQESVFRYPLSVATYGVEEVLGALDSMVTFKTTMWEKTQEFERQFAERFGGGESVMVNSGSSADLLISYAMREPDLFGLVPGDEVLAPAVTWPTQIWSLVMAGFNVKLVDVDPYTLNMSHEDLARNIGPATKAISLVHLMGNTSDLDEIRQIADSRGLVIVEDSCEALGTKWDGKPVGTFGRASSSSFFFSHHLMTMEGGMVLTQDPELAEHLRLLRAHGWTRNLREKPAVVDGIDPRYSFASWGMNVRPTELNAAFGLAQLDKFDHAQKHRMSAAAYCMQRIAPLAPQIRPMTVLPKTECSWFAFPIIVQPSSTVSRDNLVAYLNKHGVETRPIVTGNFSRQPAAKKFSEVRFGDLPGADTVHDQGFYIGLHPTAINEELVRVWDLVEACFSSHTSASLE